MDRPERAPKCPYCNKPSERATGKTIYPKRRDLQDKRFWICVGCDAYVGCHVGSWKPFGRLANAELRSAKIKAHAAFDPIWRSGWLSRSSAYKWLATALNIARDRCHIGLFDVPDCNRVIDVCTAYRNTEEFRNHAQG